jgi:hypothetical protein
MDRPGNGEEWRRGRGQRRSRSVTSGQAHGPHAAGCASQNRMGQPVARYVTSLRHGEPHTPACAETGGGSLRHEQRG